MKHTLLTIITTILATFTFAINSSHVSANVASPNNKIILVINTNNEQTVDNLDHNALTAIVITCDSTINATKTYSNIHDDMRDYSNEQTITLNHDVDGFKSAKLVKIELNNNTSASKQTLLKHATSLHILPKHSTINIRQIEFME